jgi:hypothetical protein
MKAHLTTAIIVLAVLVAYDMFIKKMVIKSTYEEMYETE